MSMLIVGIASAAVSLGGTIIGAVGAKKQRKAEEKEKERIGRKMNALESKRQPIINPYANVKDLSSMATDLSGMMSNPYGDLGVATGAAEIQMEQSDLALANTLDTLRATGASAGGATALANAALRSKRGVAASIEQQEKSNEDKRAAGEQRAQQQRMSEQQRMQQADVAGKQFVFQQTENREVAQLNRVASQLGAAQQAQAQAQADETAATLGMIGGVTSAIGGIAGAGGFNKQ